MSDCPLSFPLPSMLGLLDPLLTVGGVGAVSAAVLTYLRDYNPKAQSMERIPAKEVAALKAALPALARKIGTDQVNDPKERQAVKDAVEAIKKKVLGTDKTAGIPADELGAKR